MHRSSGPYTPADDEERRFLAAYDPSRFPPVGVTADIVLLTIRGGALCVLLVKRDGYPYKDHWALPGGFLDDDENALEAARRELGEEAGIGARGHLEQLATYSDPQRDPRMRIVSIAHLALLPDVDAPSAGSDAADARFWPVEDITSEELPLAFDHAQILADGLERAASKLEYTTLATAFCEPEFTLGELRRVYETVWGTPLHPGNFRRKVLATPGFVTPAGDGRTRAGTGGAPAALYRAGDATLMLPPLLRATLREQTRSREAIAVAPDATASAVADSGPATPEEKKKA